MVKLLGAAASACLLVLTVSSCGADASDPAATPSSPGTTPASGATPGQAASAGHEELSPNWDESPDGAPPIPDDELSDADLTALLRTTSSVKARAHCDPDDVEVTLLGFDAWTGHRSTRITVRNVSDRACLVEGVPGIGVRGQWGTTFVPEVKPDASAEQVVPVELRPGDEATSSLEWTGALAGAEAEHASLVVVQLAQGQVPVAVPARLVGDPADAPPLDIGTLTTLYPAEFVPRK